MKQPQRHIPNEETAIKSIAKKNKKKVQSPQQKQTDTPNQQKKKALPAVIS